jgi:hypothetical protein
MSAAPTERAVTDLQQLIAFLNAIQVGPLEDIRGKLGEARGRCVDLGQLELADKLAEAQAALDAVDLKTYRKRIETVISRLGHLK